MIFSKGESKCDPFATVTIPENALLEAGGGMTRSYKGSHRIHDFFYMISDEDKLYTKIVDLDKI